MPIRAVIFDIGGVLEYTPRTGWQERWAAELGLEPADFAGRMESAWHGGSTGEITPAQAEARAAAALGLTPSRLELFMDDVWAEYLGTLNEELTGYFAGLRPHYRTGILSNSFVGAREREQAAYGFADLCDVLVYSHEVGWMKPDPRVYEEACARLGVTPAEAVFLDDVPANVAGARAAGMAGVSVHRQRAGDRRARAPSARVITRR